MSACPVGRLGKHDYQPQGDVLRCRWCPATRRWPARKRMPNIALAPKRMAQGVLLAPGATEPVAGAVGPR